MNRLLAKAPELFANFVAPYLVYVWLAASHGDVFALIASAMPPLVWSVYELIKTRRVDALSVLIVGTILLTVGATFMGGSARLIQIRDALVAGGVGAAFLISLGFKRPLIFYLARATMARDTEQGAAEFEAQWARPGAPRVFRILTIVWGVGLIVQTAILCWLAWIWPIGQYLLLSPFIGYGIIGLLMLWSLRYIAKRRAIATAREVAREATQQAAE